MLHKKHKAIIAASAAREPAVISRAFLLKPCCGFSAAIAFGFIMVVAAPVEGVGTLETRGEAATGVSLESKVLAGDDIGRGC